MASKSTAKSAKTTKSDTEKASKVDSKKAEKPDNGAKEVSTAAARTTKRAIDAATTKTRSRAAKASNSSDASESISAADRIEEAIANLGDWRGRLLAKVRKLIHATDPEVIEEWKWMGTPVWSHQGMYVLANAHKDKVKLTFHHGARLEDRHKLFNAGLDGNKWRAIDFYEDDALNEDHLAALLREAIDYNASQAVPKSKGSRAKLLERKTDSKKTDSKRTSKAANGGGPILLSGGNPQIAKGDGDAPVQAYIEAMPEWKRGLGEQIDALIVRVVPDVRKAIRWNSPFYGSKTEGFFLSFHCFKRYIKVTFFDGVALDPLPPGDSKHDKVRYLDVYEKDGLDEALLERWVRQASNLPGWTP